MSEGDFKLELENAGLRRVGGIWVGFMACFCGQAGRGAIATKVNERDDTFHFKWGETGGPSLESRRAEASGRFSSKKVSRSNSRALCECNSSRAAWSAELMSRWPQFNNTFRTRREAGVNGYRSLMGQGGSSSGVDAFGCLRSLRARSALDGVSSAQRGSWLKSQSAKRPLLRNPRRRLLSSLGRRSSWELVSASCLVARGLQAALGELELRPISKHRVHDDREAARQEQPFALRIVDRFAIAKAQSLSLSWRL